MADAGVSPAAGGARARAARPSGAAVRFDAAEPVTVVLVRHADRVSR